MLNGKQRASLRALSNNLSPIFQIGKGGVNDNMLKDLDTALEIHELVKITVLKTTEKDAKDLLVDLTKALKCEPVSAIGSKIVIYRRSKRTDIEHITL